MRILVVSQYFYPETFRINDIVSFLVKSNHTVTVLTGLPNYPIGEVFDGYNQSHNNISEVFGAKVVRCKLRPRHKGLKNLLLNYLSFVIAGSKKIKTIKDNFDAILVYGVSPITQALPALKYGKKNKIPVFLYCCDLWPEVVRGAKYGHKELSKKNIIYLVAKFVSKHIYKKVDKIITKCHYFEQYLHDELGIADRKICTLYEHAESQYLNVIKKPIDNGVIDFMFLGHLGKIQNCEQILSAFATLNCNTPTALHFVGDGSESENLKLLTKRLGIENKVFFYGHVPIEETIKYYNFADVCVLALSNKTKTGFTIPAKLTGYMAACRPIVASINGESRDIIEKANCGYVCSADDLNMLSILFQKVIDNYGYFSKLGLNGRSFFEKHLTIDRFTNELVKIMQNTISERNNNY